jgi:hypothetical protein
LESTRAVETALGAAAGFGSIAVLTYLFQHYVRIQGSIVQGRVLEWCGGTVGPSAAAEVVLIGTAGPAAGAVYEAPVDHDGSYQMGVAPGLYSAAVVLQDGRQTPPMVLTPKTASGELPLTQSLELIYDVWAQVLAPRSRTITVDLAINC